MSGFTKMFNSILDSTVWYESDPVRIVWLTMMAMCDRYGCVDASVPGLAARARVPLEACEEALRRFQEPDPYSRTKDHEGKRIEVIDGGWRLLNYLKYRQKMNQEERREYLRVRQAEHRARKKNAASQQQVLTDVDAVDPDRHVGPHTDNQHIAEAEAEAEVRTASVEGDPGTINEVPYVKDQEQQRRPKNGRAASRNVVQASGWGQTFRDQNEENAALAVVPFAGRFASPKVLQKLGFLVFDANPKADFNTHADQLYERVTAEKFATTIDAARTAMADVYTAKAPADRKTERARRRKD